ncbi:RHS repeat-associated core domain-containing protein [Streptomyces poriticola]|uniref:RHS repeat-associated core domain-containing protein n=1 Tax=Streptomyces poriticola TaxID=3120506 RepID=UPI002FCE1B62
MRAFRRGVVLGASGALLAGLLSAPAFASVASAASAAAARPTDRTADVPSRSAQAVPEQQAEPTATRAPGVDWPEPAHGRVDLTRTKPGEALAVTPSGGVVDADAAGKAAESAVVAVRTPSTAQIAAAGTPPQHELAPPQRYKSTPPSSMRSAPGLLPDAGLIAPAGPKPDAVDVEVLDRTDVKPVGGVGLGLKVTRADGGTAPGPVRVDIDYSGFRNAHGGDFASRLRLVQLPACALTTPEKAGCSPDHRRFIDADNDERTGTLSATVFADADPAAVTAADSGGPRLSSFAAPATTSGATVLAVTTGSSSDEGDYRASALNPSGSWDVSVGSGAFTYDLPLRLPEAPTGATPSLSLSYNSQSVDGRTSATNNQASWAGMGWDLEVGFIQRRYQNCTQDGHPTFGDMCWDSPNSGMEPDGAMYVISLNGVTSQLIQDDDGTGSYHLQDDPGWRVQHLWGGHGSDDEYWVISSQDGMRYYFGWGRDERTRSATDSVLTVPVVGNDTGEPCHAQFPEPCTQAWRWNLDRVVDPNEVENAYFYDKQKNHYRSVVNADKARPYDAGSYLTRIEYGWASQIPGAQLPAKVELKHVGRCVERMAEKDPLTTEPAACPGISGNPESYPDVPTDLMCDGTAGDNHCAGMTYYPTFFTTDMLWDVKTYVRNDDASAWAPGMQYQMKYGLPNPEGSVGKTLWLDYVQRKGYGDGPDLRLPVINFNGEWKDNQVGSGLLNFRRVTEVHGDLGAVTRVTYGQPDACDINSLPSQSSNTQPCFWQKWTPEGETEARTGWFKKYVVTQVSEDPGVGQGAGSDGDPTMTTRYEYNGGAGWRFPNDPLTKDEDETWSDWRGYQQVEVFTGTKSNAASTYHWLYRGLDGDRTSKTDSSATRSVKVKDGFGTEYTDSAWLAGRTIETSKRDGGGSSHERTLKEYWVHNTAQYDGLPDARFVRDSKTSTHQKTSTGWRVHTVKDEYDSSSATSTTYGLPLRTNDWGLENHGDNRCTTYGRAYQTANFPGSDVKRWMVLEDERRHYAADCADRSAANRDAYAVTLYDGATSVAGNDAALADGNITEQRVHTDATHYRSTKKEYDAGGRVTATVDGEGNRTTTTYSPATSWPVQGVKVTTPDPDGTGPGTAMSTTTWSSRLWGTPYRVLDANGRTARVVHDSVGRFSQVFKPTEIGNYPGGNPSMTFDYTIPTDTSSAGVPDTVTGPPRVTTGVLQSGSSYVKEYTYLDGLGRERETQKTAPDGTGRTVVSTRYDTSGNNTGTSAPFYNSGAAGSGMVLPTVADLPSYTDLIIDFAGRTTESQILVGGEVQAAGHTRTYHHGDHTVDVPASGERKETHYDVFGQVTKVVEHGPTGPATTSYEYTRSDGLRKITDAKGNTTEYTYNWLGERVTTDDPDTGASTTTYDGNGKIATTTDAEGRTLTHEYDALQRLTAVKQGAATLSTLTYDTAPGGKGESASSTTYANGKAYTQSVTGYDDRGRITGKRTTVPDDGSGLAGTYTFGYGYDLADHMTSVQLPAIGGLPAETVTTAYTAQGNPATVTSPLATYQSAVGFDRLGRIDARTYGTSGGSGATVNRAYTYHDADGTGLLSTVQSTTTVGGTTEQVQDDTFTRDLGGQLVDAHDALTGQSECFAYDELNRLARAWTTQDTDGCAGAATPDLGSALDPYDTAYTYDELGNLQAVRDTTDAGTAVRDYTYPGYSADESAYTPGQPRPHAVTKAGADVFGYNDAGQMTSRTVDGITSALEWNAQNRVTGVTGGGPGGDEVSSYVYDAQGNVLLRTSPDEAVLYLDGHELHRTEAGGVRAARFYSAAGTAVAMRVADGSAEGELTWLLTDAQASTSLLVSTAGVVTRRRYAPFGEQRGTAGSLPSGVDKGFLGKAEDDSTGLSLLGARMYDPALGRFISPDELSTPQDPQNLNAYSYSANNPTNFSDPSGLQIAGIPSFVVERGIQESIAAGELPPPDTGGDAVYFVVHDFSTAGTCVGKVCGPTAKVVKFTPDDGEYQIFATMKKIAYCIENWDSDECFPWEQVAAIHDAIDNGEIHPCTGGIDSSGQCRQLGDAYSAGLAPWLSDTITKGQYGTTFCFVVCTGPSVAGDGKAYWNVGAVGFGNIGHAGGFSSAPSSEQSYFSLMGCASLGVGACGVVGTRSNPDLSTWSPDQASTHNYWYGANFAPGEGWFAGINIAIPLN